MAAAAGDKLAVECWMLNPEICQAENKKPICEERPQKFKKTAKFQLI